MVELEPDQRGVQVTRSAPRRRIGRATGAAALSSALLALAACDTQLGTDIARQQAKSAVNQIVANRVPGVDARPVTDCIIDNATGSEITRIAQDSVTGITDQTTGLVIQIATRQGSIDCYTKTFGPIALAKIVTAL